MPPLQRCTDWRIAAGAAVIAAAALAAYGNSFGAPFVLDDFFTVTDNPTIRHLWPILPVLHPPSDAGSGGRPLLNLSYALNYSFGRASVRGYHVFNLIIHILAGWTLFGLARRTLLRPRLSARFGASATPLALAIAAIWTAHPLLTESVTYISERSESLMGLFYLLTLYGFIRGAEMEQGGCRSPGDIAGQTVGLAPGQRPVLHGVGHLRSNHLVWFSLSFVFCLAGMATKEVMVTAPILTFLYDRTFVSGTFSRAWSRHWRCYLALAATWIPLGFLLVGLQQRSVGFGGEVSVWAYGLTECQAVVKYVGLAFWPRPLVFDYGPATVSRLGEIWPCALALALLLAASIVALRRFPAAGFACAWVFVILAPTSSLIPIIGQPISENRMYLPLAGIVALALLGAYAWAGRRSLVLFVLLAVILAFASSRRNQDYSSALAIWTDTIEKRPANYRAHNALANDLRQGGNLQEAIGHYRQALERAPPTAIPYFLAVIHYNLGRSLRQIGQKDEALGQFQAALALSPGISEAHNSLGVCLVEKGRWPEAIRQFEEALRLKPDNVEARRNLDSVQPASTLK